MFLSAHAKQLLLEGKFLELQALPISQLLGGFEPNQLSEYGFVREHLDEAVIARPAAPQPSQPLQSQPSIATVYPNAGLRDAVLYVTLNHAVVISSGHIYSRESVDQMLLQRNPTCPNTREPIDPEKIVALPQIDYALKLLKFEKDNALHLAELIEFKITASSNKFRVKYKESQHATRLQSLLAALFDEKNNKVELQNPQSGYSVAEWNRAWRHGQVEWWFRKGYFSNEEANSVIDAITKPLALPVDDAPYDIAQKYDMRTGEDRTYVDIFTANITYQQVALCVIAFLRFSDQQRRKLDVADTDEAISASDSHLNPPVHLGQGMFGRQQRQIRIAHSIATSSGAPSSVMPSQRPGGGGTQLH